MLVWMPRFMPLKKSKNKLLERLLAKALTLA